MQLRRFTIFAILILLAGCHTPSILSAPSNRRDPSEYIQLVKLASEGIGWKDLSITDSAVYVHSPEIDNVVTCGSDVVPYLLQKMREPDISFDAFVRCYSAAAQIATAEGRLKKIYWSGGAVTKVGRLEPGEQRFDQAFRDRVSKSIEDCFSADPATM